MSANQLSEHFQRHEFACKCGCGFNDVDPALIVVLENIREVFNSPVIINSACRCPSHNARVGGSVNSQHPLGKAADIVVQGAHADEVADYLEDTYPDTYGIGRYDGRTHIDVRHKRARWDKRTE